MLLSLKEGGKEKTNIGAYLCANLSGHTVLRVIFTRILFSEDGYLPFYGEETRALRDG